MRNMIKPPPSPLHSGEGESLSEWFCHVDTATQSECSSLSLPFAELSMSYMDDASDTSSYSRDVGKEDDGFGSDSGFSSDICADLKSNATTPKEKFPAEKFRPTCTLDESDCAKLTRTKWTASFRKLMRRLKK
ncbi:unnamed protein product [Phaedon cochleariae]|uniref:Uncharacterized protein n=1 Tax=Phaedon cochleariae TaxID=80249 RepID=A0A9N9SG47_PHACE|nr:unnamed protein product [Phaedon cochleariae]